MYIVDRTINDNTRFTLISTDDIGNTVGKALLNLR